MKHITVLLISIFSCNVVISWRLGDLEFANSEVKEFKQDGGKEFEATQQSDHGEKGDKGYSGHHEVEKGSKGHHDKEGHKKQYAEDGGNKKSHQHDDGYYAEQHKGEKGAKGYHYEDKGSYAKGHSTKGHHNIHKLDEFKKNTDFFDENHDEAFKEKHGGFEEKKATSSGERTKGGHFKKAFLENDFGKSGKSEKGAHYFDDSGFKKAQGRDGFYTLGADFAQKGGNDQFKNYGFLIRH